MGKYIDRQKLILSYEILGISLRESATAAITIPATPAPTHSFLSYIVYRLYLSDPELIFVCPH
jgi:hypothetical protein